MVCVVGASFCPFLADHLDNIGFRSSVADPDVWLRPALKPDGEKYYEYALIYVDDIMVIIHDLNLVINKSKRNLHSKVRNGLIHKLI